MQFTDRKLQILEQLAAGNEYKDIADTLGITRDTVKNHVYQMLEQSGTDNKTHLVAQAFRAGLLR